MGGQRRRVALARALAKSPKLLFADGTYRIHRLGNAVTALASGK